VFCMRNEMNIYIYIYVHAKDKFYVITNLLTILIILISVHQKLHNRVGLEIKAGADVTTSLFMTRGASVLAVRPSGTGVSFMSLEQRVLAVLHHRGVLSVLHHRGVFL